MKTARSGLPRYCRVIAEMKNGNRHDKGEVEPVRDIYMWFVPLRQCREEYEQVHNPNDSKPKISIPLGLGIFFGLRDAQQITRTRDQNEKIIAENNKPR